MARLIRVYEKKRGHRCTGTGKLGSAGEMLFFGGVFLIGCAGLVVTFAQVVIPEWRVNHEFIANTCRLLDARVGQLAAEDGVRYRPELQIEYQLKDRVYRTWTYDIRGAYYPGREEVEAILERFEVDPVNPREYPCWYDPADPSVAVLVRGYTWWYWLLFAVPVSFVLIGGGGLLYGAARWGRSAERVAAWTGRAARLDLFQSGKNGDGEYPATPPVENVTNSPGTRLKYRLPILASPGWPLFTLALACVVCNVVVAVLAGIAVQGHLSGDPDWLSTLFVIPFGGAGLVLVAFFLRQVARVTAVPPTLLEVSDHPLFAGGRYRLFLSQPGKLEVRSLAVLLVCEEEARYREGTQRRTEVRRVHEEEVFRREKLTIKRGATFETVCDLVLPSAVMHSFQAPNNEVRWGLLVRGRLQGRADFQRAFAIVVYPAVERPAV